jgi:regulator of RNase E activity RraA
VPVECGGVEEGAGDFVLGGHDGVVVALRARCGDPSNHPSKSASEDAVRALAQGMSVAEAFRTFGVL